MLGSVPDGYVPYSKNKALSSMFSKDTKQARRFSRVKTFDVTSTTITATIVFFCFGHFRYQSKQMYMFRSKKELQAMSQREKELVVEYDETTTRAEMCEAQKTLIHVMKIIL